MKRFRSLIALVLSLALVVLSPGSSAYQAAAQTMNSAASVSGSASATGAVGSNLGVNSGVSAIPTLSPSALSLTSVLSAPSITPSALQGAAVIPAASVATPAAINAAASQTAPVALKAVVPAAAKAVVVTPAGVAAAKALAIETLKTNLSAPSVESKGVERQAADASLRFDGQTLKSELSAPAVAGAESKSNTALKAAKQPVVADETGDSSHKTGEIDSLGNATRVGDHGPDSHEEPSRGGHHLLGLFGIGMLAGGIATVSAFSFGTIAMFPMIILSLVLHEIGHARMADKLGDPTARLQNRASFNPRHWMTHIDPIWTLLIPAVTFLMAGMIFGGARPVPVEPRYFKNPVKDMALVALAGPAVNMGLAAAGALAITGAIAAGLGSAVVAMLGMFVFLNVLLAIFNLIPLPPLDGSHMLKAFLPYQARIAMDNFMAKLGPMGVLLPMMLIFYVAGGAISGAAMFIAKLMIGGVMSVTGVHMASAFLPAVAALGLAVGQLGAGKAAQGQAAAAAAPAPGSPNNGGAAASGGGNAPVDLIVMFGEKKTKLRDSHISSVDVNLPQGVDQYTRLQQAMLAQLETAGLDSAALEPYKGTPLATYSRINAATIRVDGASVAEFTKKMTDSGFKVYANSRREIIRPITIKPEDMDPSARNAVTMDENLKIVKMDTVHAAAEKLWGKPELGFWSGLWAKVFKSEPAQPKFGVIDSGADTSHPLLKRVKEVKNMTSGENVDDIGHGSWVTSTVLHMAPWSRNTTHYKTFLNGGATLDDILKALTTAGNDGNLVISNSWGDDQGDPNGPDAQLVKKLAQEGHIMVFAAGNAGSGANTVGAPAIVTYKDPTTGAIRVVSVAASDRNKKVAYFSSRGPGSPITAKDPNYSDHRPDLMAVGYNIEGAWPAALGDADRTDGEKGTVKAISGTSMSTPGVDGAIAMLCMLFGVVEIGPKLDAIVVAVMSSLEKTGKNTVDEEGDGFLNVDAAYQKLSAQFTKTPPDIASYRALKSRLNTLNRFVAMTGVYGATNIAADELARATVEIGQVTASIRAMEAADNTLAYRAAGPIKRFILNATGAAPKP